MFLHMGVGLTFILTPLPRLHVLTFLIMNAKALTAILNVSDMLATCETGGEVD
jgi:hypothetical protein